MKIVSLHMIERQKVEERYVYCPKCDAKLEAEIQLLFVRNVI
ncbi:hypothetical protein [Bacillus cereus group sp. Bce019]